MSGERETVDNEAVYRRVMVAVSMEDEAALDDLLNEHLIDHNPIPDQQPGRDGFKQWMRSARSSFPDLDALVEDVVVEGDRLAGRVRYRGTHRGTFLGIPPTDKPVEFEAFHLVRFAEGRIVEWWGMADLLRAVHQIGAGITP